LSESLIKDRLVLGIRDKNVKDRLLRTKNLDLVKAVEICKAAEITNKQMEILCTTSGKRTDEFQSVMELGPTDWVNFLVIVDKPNGDFRICIDPTDLNKAIKREYFSIPTYVDIMSKVRDAKVF
jgi:hypothetical protein